MTVLMISGDTRILMQGTPAAERLQLQKDQTDRLDVYVWPQVHSAYEIVRAARAHQYAVVTAQDPFWRGLLALIISWITGARLNIQVHTDLSKEPFFRHLLAHLTLRHADAVRTVSKKLETHLREMGIRTKVHILPIYVNLDRFRTLSRQPQATPTILWLGRFEPEKDPLKAIDVLREVRKTIDAKLIMLGEGSLEEKVREHSVELPVEFPGWQDPTQYLPSATVVLSTSRYESWGASIVEALAAGVPVVSLDTGVAREAGATIAEPARLSEKVIEVLEHAPRGELKLKLPTAEEWARQWRATLL